MLSQNLNLKIILKGSNVINLIDKIYSKKII